MFDLGVSTIRRFIKNRGAARVSEEATEVFKEYIEDYGREISQIAIKLAELSGRKTVKKNDIYEAKKLYERR